MPRRMLDTEKIASKSQQSDNEDFREQKITAGDRDLGSRVALENEPDLIWYPAEVNTSIRPGWFYHEQEDDNVRSLESLLDIYYRSVGGNATFLLNIPPDKNGLLHPNDVARLKEMGDFLSTAFRNNLCDTARMTVDSSEDGHGIDTARKDSYADYFKTPDGVQHCSIDVCWDSLQTIKFVVLKENILCSQRIENFCIEAFVDGKWVTLHSGTVVGYKKIVPLNAVLTNHVRITIQDARVAPTLAFLGIY